MQRISVADVKQRLDRGEPVVFVDARSDEAWQKSDVQIPGSVRVSPNRAADFAGVIPNDAAIVTYCT